MSQSSVDDLTKKIKAEATNLGFDLFGVTAPTIPLHIRTYKQWIADQKYAGMDYLARESAILRRENPASNLDGCQSIIVLGLAYPGPHSFPSPTETTIPRGRVAAYARGVDYHIVVTDKTQQLIAFIQSLVQTASFRAYVDTGPILERDLAQAAGLGWIGKNTCLISPHQGSYFFLAEIFSDLPLEPSSPFTPNHCGICRRCIENCPTQCILPNHTIDSQRCISYLTIENKGAIPLKLRPNIQNWVFGCDICQLVCPWNTHHHQRQGDASLAPKNELAYPALLEDLRLSPQEFDIKFRQSPVKRAHRRGYLRNIAVALGNQIQPEHLSEIVAVLAQEPDALVRAHLYWAISQLNSNEAGLALENFRLVESDSQALSEIEAGLKTII